MDSNLRSLNPNKHIKEQFVSNLTGSSMLEIAALSTIVPLLFVLRHAVCSQSKTGILLGLVYRVAPCQSHDVASVYAFDSGAWTKKNDDPALVSSSPGTYLATLTVDFLFIVLPALLFFTVLAEWVYVFAVALPVLVFTVIVLAKRFTSTGNAGESVSLRLNISSYRVCVMIMTCLCILAVDFTVFPRRYAKTETYGTSLMDLGVGSFVLANSLVSRQARSVSSVSWKTAIRSTSPLLFLGFGRLLSTRSVDYQVHVGEYGVHWNFFFTLAAVSILTSIINIPTQYSGMMGSIVLIGYQCWLNWGLNIFLLSDKRGTDILSKNKEGIFSILGYWGMYLIGVQLGNYIFFRNHSSASLRTKKWARIRVVLSSLVFWLMTVLLDRHVERVSRRMCNLAYVTLVLAQNFQVLALLMLSDYIGGSKISSLEEAFDRNLLGSFLLANLLTGLVNLYMDTPFTPSLSAISILLVYAYVLTIITGIAYYFGIRLKFW